MDERGRVDAAASDAVLPRNLPTPGSYLARRDGGAQPRRTDPTNRTGR